MKASALKVRALPVASAGAEPAGRRSFVGDAPEPSAVEPQTLQTYLDTLVHDWCRTLTMLGFGLIPAFYVLDLVMMPSELLPRFAVYRGLTTAIVLSQYLVVRQTRASNRSLLHGYFFSLIVGAMIVLMTTNLGGFHSTYYAGLNLVVIAVNLLLPWSAIHTALTSLLIIGLYIVLNLVVPQPEALRPALLVNNLYFMGGTAIIAVAINTVKHRLIVKEFLARQELKVARDALWGEMEVAKHIQTALLPQISHAGGYEVAAVMRPADEVGGDYYDVIVTPAGESWVSIGDVSGHGVESGLVMMMAQTSLLTTVDSTAGLAPSRVLARVNTVIKENIRRLRADRYMTMTAMRLEPTRIVFAGAHQDLLIYRAARGAVEVVPTTGTWLGIVERLDGLVPDAELSLGPGDVLLLYTDGVTEATNASGEMFGEERLEAALLRHIESDMAQLVERLAEDVAKFTDQQSDDVTIVAVALDRPATSS